MNEINLINETKNSLEIFEPKFQLILNETKKTLKIKNTQLIDLFFITKQKMKRINKKYRNKDYVTDVVSIEYANIDKSIPINFLGTIYICYDKAVAQANEYGHSLEREICFLYLHGVLHILGYDHINLRDEKIMFALQDKILNKVKIYR